VRVNVDSKALADPRFARLGARLKMNRHEALGRCLVVWSAALGNRSARMSAADIDAHADRSGFAKAMVAVDLAQTNGKKKLRIRGVEPRVEWLLEQDEKRELANAARKRKNQIESKKGDPRDVPAGKILDGTSSPPAASHGMVPVSSDLDPALVHDHDHEQKSRVTSSSSAGLIPPAPDGWTPPAGGAADEKALKRIALGELSPADVARCAEAFYAKTNGQTFSGGAKHRDRTLC